MKEPEPAACANCGREQPSDQLDRHGWCSDCRRVVVRRATWVGRAAGVLASVAVVALMVWLAWTPAFFVVWALIVAAVYFVAFTFVRRVAFEVIRGRGVSPPSS